MDKVELKHEWKLAFIYALCLVNLTLNILQTFN